MKRYLIFIGLLFLMFSCSTRYINPRLDDFSEASDLIGKNIVYVFEQLQEKEKNILVKRLTRKDLIKPDDFRLKILNRKRLEIRKNLVKNLVDYTRLLSSLFVTDYQKTIMKNADIFYENIDSISINHKNFLTAKEQGVLTAIAQSIPEVLTYSKRKFYCLKLMKEMQPLLEKITEKLKEELVSVKLLIDTYYLKDFMDKVADKWPKTESKRLKYSKIGMKIIEKRNKIKTILKDLIDAVDYIPKTHRELRKALKNNGNPLKNLKELINFAYRINETYKEFAKIGN